MNKSLGLLILLSLLGSFSVRAEGGLAAIEALLEAGSYASAEQALTAQMTALKAAGNWDSLAFYLPLVGRTAYYQQGQAAALPAAEAFLQTFLDQQAPARSIRQVYLELGSFHEWRGDQAAAFEANKEALVYAEKAPEVRDEEKGLILLNIGTLAQRLGDINLCKDYYLRAKAAYLADSLTSPESLVLLYNGLGNVNWFTSRLDSAYAYYQLALQTLERTDSSARNQYYRPAMINNNMAAILSNQGRSQEAIEVMRKVISLLEKYIPLAPSEPVQLDARMFRFQAIENLAGQYRELGDWSKTLDLLTYSLRQKEKYLPEDSPEHFKAQILVGQTHFYLNNFELAANMLDKGLELIEAAPGAYLYWAGDAHYYKALVDDALRRPAAARVHFEAAEDLYKKSITGDYYEIYLNLLNDAAIFYADQGDREAALDRATRGYVYVLERQGKASLVTLIHTNYLSDVYRRLGQHDSSLYWANVALENAEEALSSRVNLFDSLQFEYRRADAVVLRTRARYALNPDPSVSFLKSLLAELDPLVEILDKQKSTHATLEGLQVIIHQNGALFHYLKKLSQELYDRTAEEAYLNRLLSLHESSLYNRIRRRLNEEKKLQFVDVPPAVMEREQVLRASLSTGLSGEESPDTNPVQAFFSKSEAWQAYLDSLQQNHPRYFKMRFGSILLPVEDLQSNLNPGSSLVRYLFIEEELFALIVNASSSHFVQIQADSIASDLRELGDMSSPELSGTLLHKLYRDLWEPVIPHLENQRVVIVPDRELFNLSFELLLPSPTKSWEELTERCLLNTYIFSYNYSLFLLEKPTESPPFKENFVGFAPGFLDEMKAVYLEGVEDSMLTDQTYLQLLPQPFMVDLGKKLRQDWGGDFFVEEASTESAFKNREARHKIIYIGTHAESNNVMPERSRLIFAKNPRQPEGEDNYLYTHEIYNCDLRAKVTILSACETGKPGFQPGEGMISIAHAVNYAGSESIVTGLWKIDEKASAEITGYFYEYLAQGKAKDEALRQAKLAYLTTARGRTLSPQYWGGLVIMGDVSPVELSPATSWWWLLLVGGILLFSWLGWRRVKA
ncbi:MAG: CHAT domain-containing tetratricopeptide repeat protein [Bacteroidota bacterium]